jgi:hypothetical protein
MARILQYISISTLLVFMLTTCALPHPAMGQATTTQQQQPSNTPSYFRPVPLAHLYWHFLVLQNFLDTKAAEQKSRGKDGSGLRNQLQKKVRLSDADFAPIRTSSARLTVKVKDLDAQAVAIQKTGASPSNRDRLKALTVQRETDINAEISYLKKNMSPEQIKSFEAFLTQFFSPTNAVPRPPVATGQPAPAAVKP